MVPKKPALEAGGAGGGVGGPAVPAKNLNRKNLKKNHKRRSAGGLKSEPKPENSSIPTSPIKKASPRKNIRRKSSTEEQESEEEDQDAPTLRDWISNYEEAVTNHYSPELRSRLQAVKLPPNFFKPKDVNGIR